MYYDKYGRPYSMIQIFELAFAIIFLALIIFMIICLWKIYEKAGEHGWACLVPIYSYFVLARMACKNYWFCFIILLLPVTSYPAFIVVNIGLAKAFGKGVGMILLLIFLPIIALPMLAYGNTTYDAELRLGE